MQLDSQCDNYLPSYLKHNELKTWLLQSVREDMVRSIAPSVFTTGWQHGWVQPSNRPCCRHFLSSLKLMMPSFPHSTQSSRNMRSTQEFEEYAEEARGVGSVPVAAVPPSALSLFLGRVHPCMSVRVPVQWRLMFCSCS